MTEQEDPYAWKNFDKGFEAFRQENYYEAFTQFFIAMEIVREYPQYYLGAGPTASRISYEIWGTIMERIYKDPDKARREMIYWANFVREFIGNEEESRKILEAEKYFAQSQFVQSYIEEDKLRNKGKKLLEEVEKNI